MRKYYVNDEERTESDFWDLLSEAIDNEVEITGTYTTMSEIFGRLDSELILRNRTESDILKLSFKLWRIK